MCDTVPILPIMNDYKSHIGNDLHRSQGQCLFNVLNDEYQGQGKLRLKVKQTRQPQTEDHSMFQFNVSLTKKRYEWDTE